MWLGFYRVSWKTSLVSKLFSGARFQVKPALMWGDNSSIDSGASFLRWLMMVTSARFSCFVPSFLHQSAFVFCCYALVLGDQVSYVVMLSSFVSPDLVFKFSSFLLLF